MNTFCLDHPWQRHTLDTRNDFQDPFWNESDGVSRVIDGDGYCGLIGEIADGVTQGELMFAATFFVIFFLRRGRFCCGDSTLSMTRDRVWQSSRHSSLPTVHHLSQFSWRTSRYFCAAGCFMVLCLTFAILTTGFRVLRQFDHHHTNCSVLEGASLV